MKLPRDIVISDDKLTRYLLVPRVRDDKSRFLARAGFFQENPEDLKRALIFLAKTHETVEDEVNDYGEFLRTDGVLTGANGRKLPVTAIWLRHRIDNSVHFVTLKPRKEK